MVIKTYDLAGAVRYHDGAFPPKALDYERLLGPLEEAAASLARYDAKISGMVNGELFLAPLRRQDAVTSSRMEGTISTIEDLYLNQTGFTGEHKAWKVSHDQRKFRKPFFDRSAGARSAFGA